ncbi:Uncharacterised protein [Klebsiella aerogenes]|nr:Uncharacterised protein [Klebsiella aerogenes]
MGGRVHQYRRQACRHRKKILDGRSVSVTVFPGEGDPDGTLAGLEATFTGQTFRVAFSGEDEKECLYRNDNGIATLITQTTGQAQVNAINELLFTESALTQLAFCLMRQGIISACFFPMVHSTLSG